MMQEILNFEVPLFTTKTLPPLPSATGNAAVKAIVTIDV
jgi:hypothetical protein